MLFNTSNRMSCLGADSRRGPVVVVVTDGNTLYFYRNPVDIGMHAAPDALARLISTATYIDSSNIQYKSTKQAESTL